MIQKQPITSSKTKGVLLTLSLSFTFLIIMFGPILKSPNEYYFASGGDGLQTYFAAVYHTKYDTTFLRQQSINYPYGENIFFTGGMPAITNSIKLIKPVIDLSANTVGIINILMLISIPLSALFLFLIFEKLKVQWVYATLVSFGIAFLSPQMERLGGHFALTFQFILPMYICFLMSFFEAPDYKKSVIIGILIFVASSQHLYFFGFTGFISVIFFSTLFLNKNLSLLKKHLLAFHFFIQTILPYLFLQILLFISDNAKDRTFFPWGFLKYRANDSSIFFPFWQWYEPIIKKIITPISYEWEGKAFIGLVSCVVFFLIIILSFKKIIQKRPLTITGNIFLDILLLSSLVSLLFSFGYPFLHFEYLLKYTGPIKQLRGIGRFSWIFYYTINICSFYLIYQWCSQIKPQLKYIVFTVVICLLFSEAYTMTRSVSKSISNKVPELNDIKNVMSNYQWINKIDPSNYQAVLPLPYFHIGSEDILLGDHSKIVKYSYIVSLKSGIPLYAVSASRTSLSQTYHNISIVTDNTYGPDMPPIGNKPFLVLCKKENLIRKEEILLYSKSKF